MTGVPRTCIAGGRAHSECKGSDAVASWQDGVMGHRRKMKRRCQHVGPPACSDVPNKLKPPLCRDARPLVRLVRAFTTRSHQRQPPRWAIIRQSIAPRCHPLTVHQRCAQQRSVRHGGVLLMAKLPAPQPGIATPFAARSLLPVVLCFLHAPSCHKRPRPVDFRQDTLGVEGLGSQRSAIIFQTHRGPRQLSVQKLRLPAVDFKYRLVLELMAEGKPLAPQAQPTRLVLQKADTSNHVLAHRPEATVNMI